MDFGKNQDRLEDFLVHEKRRTTTVTWQLNWVFSEQTTKRNFSNIKKQKVGDWNYKQILLLFNQTAVAADEFPQDEDVRPILTTALAWDLEEQLNDAQNAVTIVKRQEKKIIATNKKLKNYCIDKNESSHAKTGTFTRLNEE